MSKTWSQYVAEAEQYELYKQRCEQLEAVLAALLDHAERIQEHVPQSERWYAVRDAARALLPDDDETDFRDWAQRIFPERNR